MTTKTLLRAVSTRRSIPQFHGRPALSETLRAAIQSQMPDRGASDQHEAIRMGGMAVALWSGHLRHNPANPDWLNRDRFIIADKRAALLLPVLQRLSGYQFPDRVAGLKDRSQGIGLPDAIGLALTESLLGEDFNRPGHSIVDHHTYVFVTESVLDSTLSRRACAMAGSLRLKKLVVLSDEKPNQQGVAVESLPLSPAHQRLVHSGWQVVGPVDGQDVIAVGRAIAMARHCADKPTLIRCVNSPQSTTGISEGSPDAAIWNMREMGALREQSWQRSFDDYARRYPDMAARLHQQSNTRLERVQKEIVSNLLQRLEATGIAVDPALQPRSFVTH